MAGQSTQTEIASALGLAKSRITAMKKMGCPVSSIQAAKAWHSQNIMSTKSWGDELGGGSIEELDAGAAEKPEGQSEAVLKDYQNAKALNEKYKALKCKLEYELLNGTMVNADEARLFAADLGATVRSSLEALPDRLAPELVSMPDMESIRAVLVESFEQVLNDLADKIKKMSES